MGRSQAIYAKKKRIGDLDELKAFRKKVLNFYGIYRIVYISPWIEGLEKKYRDLSLHLRESVHDVANDIDDVYLDYFKHYHPEYNDVMRHLLSSEIFSLKKAPFSKNDLEEFRKRKAGGLLPVQQQALSLPRTGQNAKRS